MNFRVLVIILLTIILTVFFLENNQIIEINFWIMNARISKSILLPSLTLIGFFIGYISGHIGSYNRRKRKELKEAKKKELTQNKNIIPNLPKSLSQEDQDYIL